MTAVCFFGAYDPAYPRNRILRRGLELAGMNILEARVRERRAWRRYPALIRAFVRVARDADILFVPEFRHKDMPLARWLRGRRRLVFDPLISRHDTLVRDWRLHREGSAQARWNRAIDRWALAAADLVLCDTWAHGELFQQLGARHDRLRRVLVGAEERFFQIGPSSAADCARIVYVGGFLPLHGVRTVIEAAALLEERKSGPFRIELFGTGIDYLEARELAQARGLRRVRFAGRIPYEESSRVLTESDIVLGAFGITEKAGRVIPHKVFQGLAAGRAVVTGDGAGVREVFEPGVHLDMVPRGNPAALAAALERLIENQSARAALGAAGRACALEIATPQRIGAALRRSLEDMP